MNAPRDRCCPECEYPLADLPEPTCPECGTALTPEAWTSRRPKGLLVVSLVGLVVSGFLMSATGVLSVIGVPYMLAGVVLAGSLPPEGGARVRRRLRWLAVAAWAPTVVLLVALGWAVWRF